MPDHTPKYRHNCVYINNYDHTFLRGLADMQLRLFIVSVLCVVLQIATDKFNITNLLI